MKQLLQSLVILFILASPLRAEVVEQEPLTFGVLPIMSPVTLLKRFTPLSQYLSERLPRTVIIQSARDFPTFVKRVNERGFDLVYTAPHFVDLAMEGGRYELLVTPGSQLAASVVVRRQSAYQSLDDLRGRLIAHAPEQAFIPIVGKALFEDAGIGEAAGTRFVVMRSHNAAYEAVEGGEADAAIISSYIATRQLPADQWREISRTDLYPGVAILVASDLDPELKTRMRSVLLSMGEDTLGQSSLKQTLFAGFALADAADYQRLRRFLKFAPGMQAYLEDHQ